VFPDAISDKIDEKLFAKNFDDYKASIWPEILRLLNAEFP